MLGKTELIISEKVRENGVISRYISKSLAIIQSKLCNCLFFRRTLLRHHASIQAVLVAFLPLIIMVAQLRICALL
jgi:hypothetical protein